MKTKWCHIYIDNRVFHKLSAIQEFQHCQLYLSSETKINLSNEVFKLQMWSSYTPWFRISHLLTSIGANEDEKYKYMGIQSWQQCKHCQLCVFAKNSNIKKKTANNNNVNIRNYKKVKHLYQHHVRRHVPFEGHGLKKSRVAPWKIHVNLLAQSSWILKLLLRQNKGRPSWKHCFANTHLVLSHWFWLYLSWLIQIRFEKVTKSFT